MTQNKTEQQPKNAVAVMKKEVADSVLTRIDQLQKEAGLVIPANYAVTNQINLAWLRITEMVHEDNGVTSPVLEVVTKASVANALLDMVLQGMDIQKKQGYFIVYRNKKTAAKELTFSRSYFGDEKLARQQGMKKCVPVIVYEGDEFQYAYAPDGEVTIVKHTPDIGRINKEKIIAAYAVVTMENGERHVQLKTIAEIRQAWMQGATKGNSPAHRNFTAEMAGRTVMRSSMKHIINSSDDAWLYGDKPRNDDEVNTERPKSDRGAEDIHFEEVQPAQLGSSQPAESFTPQPQPDPIPVTVEEEPSGASQAEDEDPFRLK